MINRKRPDSVPIRTGSSPETRKRVAGCRHKKAMCLNSMVIMALGIKYTGSRVRCLSCFEQ